MKKLFLLLLVLGTLTHARAQGLPGYVITLAGDTLWGTIVEKSQQRVVLYRAKQPTIIYRPSHLRGYGVGRQEAFRSRVVRLSSGVDSVRIVRLVQQGQVSLYSSGTDALLQPAGQDELYELTPLNWHLLFHRYLSGCAKLPVSSPEALQVPFSREEIERQVVVYNNCIPTNRVSMLTEDRSQGWLGRYGIWGGATRTAMSLQDEFRDYLPKRTQFGSGYGLGLEAMAVRANGLFVGGQVAFSQHHTATDRYSYSLYTDSGFKPYTEQLEFSYVQSSIRANFGSSFGAVDILTPYVALGVALTKTYRTKEVITRSPGSSKQEVLEKQLGDGGNLFLEGNAGVWIKATATTSLRLSLQYSWGYLTNPTFNASSTQVVMGQVGYFFSAH
ncbi:hypothetical protein [Hymenobacter elongatus]|uniref:Outer membrane protein beta-barrel domain-containing protein n=1 Tax=Hymenobacter elongatus TaxID=877208 RepID=A0A4Z0PPL9_9BACT|nr:hypothetical protein [Hymenobacter elongatus]TGE18616.1 hypothetical protein E5J99_04745 [Hymenobacter elongatus]